MKGTVFSEFIELVEERFSPELADEIIEAANLPSGGAYTAVGTYDHAELIELVGLLSQKSGIDVPSLVRTFGTHLAGRFTRLYPGFFDGVDGVFDFLGSIEEHVHVEVRKLYPDAELPTFRTERADDEHMKMIYRSGRPFADLAEGLIGGCADHFGEHIEISRTDSRDGEQYVTEFALVRAA